MFRATEIIANHLNSRSADQFLTLSVRHDQKALRDFVAAVPHRRIIESLAPHIGRFQLVQWPWSPPEIPLDWNAAKPGITQT